MPIDEALVRRLMAFAADMLGYLCPEQLPQIEINPDLHCKGAWYRPEPPCWPNPLIELREWDGGAFWQGVMIHELVHHLQWFSGKSVTEGAAVAVQVSWLLKIKAPVEAFPHEMIIEMLTGDIAA